MRNTIINTIFEAAHKNSHIMLLVGDLGYSVVEKFQKELPNQFVNVGIAEQNMIGLAAGLALSGKKVFVYSIIPFATLRCLEQIKVDVCYQNLDVNIIGVGSGYAYGQSGATHQSVEDVAAMRVLPNMKILSPADPMQAKELVENMLLSSGPYYLRLNKGGEPNLPWLHGVSTNIEKSVNVKIGKDANFLCTGTIVAHAYDVIEKLKADDLDVGIIYFTSIKPIDKNALKMLVELNKPVFTLEENCVIGGFGSAVAEEMLELGFKDTFKRFGVSDCYYHTVGTQNYMRDLAGLSVEKIYIATKGLIK